MILVNNEEYIMDFAINRKAKVTAKYQHKLKNLEGVEVVVEPNESLTLLLLHCTLGNTYCAIKKRTKGLILLPLSLFDSFNNFKGQI